MNFTYDDIYGVTLDEYVKRHGLDLEDLINKTKMDIAILKENLGKVIKDKLPYPDSYLETIIFQTIKKKERHLQHLLDWEISGITLE
jgi:hypothetical protein